METILQLAARNTERAKQIVQATNIINIWESIGAEINLVGSLKMGLMMKHRDIDFHVYTPRLTPAISFQAIMQLAANPAIKRIEYKNLIDTDEHCIEWHVWYEDTDHELWQIDMIHILKGSYYDGYFEQVAERISAVLTPEIRETILKLKYETPDTEEIKESSTIKPSSKTGFTIMPLFKTGGRHILQTELLIGDLKLHGQSLYKQRDSVKYHL